MSDEWDWHLLVIIQMNISTSWLLFQGIEANQLQWEEGRLMTSCIGPTKWLERNLPSNSGISSPGTSPEEMNPQESRNGDTSLYDIHCSYSSHTLSQLGLGNLLSLLTAIGDRWRCTTLLSQSIGAHLQQLPKWRRTGKSQKQQEAERKNP